MRLIQAPLLSAVGIIAQAVPNHVGNIAQTMPRKVGKIARVVPMKRGNFTQAMPSSVGNGDGPSNDFEYARDCRCAVLLTILFGGIVFGIIALQTPKVKPVEEEIPEEEECPPSTTPTTVYRISSPPIDTQKKDASTQKAPIIIFATDEPLKKRPSGPSSGEEPSSTGETTESGLRSSDSCGRSERSSQERIAAQDKSICECLKKPPTPPVEEPVTCVCGKAHKDSCVHPRKKKTRKRRREPSQTGSAGRPYGIGSITRSPSRRDSRRRSRTYDDPRTTRGSPPDSLTSSRSRPRAKRKPKK